MDEALALLDGKVHTLAVLEGAGDHWPKLTIGGREGAYVVMYARSGADAGWWDLHSDGSAEEFVTLVIGGQDGDYPSDLLNSRAAMRRAASHFFETGEMDPSLVWRKASP
ncbi:hypothetical protein KPL74_09050 [Bacillus sp. NP157]|nr:hypothetical protein KPL74_09050 [Bacillus sp. NP157]